MKHLKTILIILGSSILICYFLGFLLCSFVANGYKFVFKWWYLTDDRTFMFMGFFLLVELLVILWYYQKNYWLLNSKNIIKGKKRDLHLPANLEQSRFQTDKELEENFTTVEFRELQHTEIIGTPIKAEQADNRLNITFSKPAHTLVIGTTGSGKTTTFVNPMIQILGETKTKPSMFISDPKGELYADHAEALKKRGYEVKVLDLRNPYNSVRWNPLERAYTFYQRMLHLEDEVIVDERNGCYIFDGRTYFVPEEKDAAVQVKKQQLYDIVYEDLHDITTVLCPVNNKNEPMWESGAKNLVLAIALAMLEDSENPKLELTKEKYNFFSITKVATNTENDCEELLNYFRGRSPLSKAVSLSKQVLDASDKTRGSYLSSTFDKLAMFADQSLCALTSENEIKFGSMGEKPIALFLQIPDEKETRHTLAAMVILQAYKELVYKANSYESLSLPRPVYFILDEFGNLPKVHKLEQMITVGRSRNIWLNLVVQSYAQLAKVYDDKSADIIKSNCNIQVFIGTTDYKTIEEFSKRCGNFSIMQRSVGFNSSKGEDINSNTSVKERPLIYPSELQRLNNNGNMGNAVVTVFGYFPIKSRFTPSFKCKFYDMERCKQELAKGRYFDEHKAFYDMRKRNALLSVPPADKPQDMVRQHLTERRKNKLILDQIKDLMRKGLNELIPDEDVTELLHAIDTLSLEKALAGLEQAKKIAKESKRKNKVETIEDVIRRIKDYLVENQKY